MNPGFLTSSTINPRMIRVPFFKPLIRADLGFRDANTGVGQDVTGLAAAVQLRLRVAFGLQALQRCSGLLNRRARGSTVATHHFADVAQQRQQQFRKLPGALPHESASLSIGSISASVVKLLSSSASNGEFAGGSPAGCTNSWACG